MLAFLCSCSAWRTTILRTPLNESSYQILRLIKLRKEKKTFFFHLFQWKKVIYIKCNVDSSLVRPFSSRLLLFLPKYPNCNIAQLLFLVRSHRHKHKKDRPKHKILSKINRKRMCKCILNTCFISLFLSFIGFGLYCSIMVVCMLKNKLTIDNFNASIHSSNANSKRIADTENKQPLRNKNM